MSYLDYLVALFVGGGEMVNKRNFTALRRGKLEIYYDLLASIREEKVTNRIVKPTRVQHRCNMAYDKMLRYLNELARKDFISKKPPIRITEKGENFMLEFEKIKEQFDKIILTYM